MMSIRIQRLTRKQLAEVVESYSSAFPDWKVIGGERLVRSFGPILQQIGFERLRSGAYRTSSGIRALSMPQVAMLHQLLDIRHRDVLLREHPAMRQRVITEMEQQFQPSVRKPLDLREVKRLCEKDVKQSVNDLCMLAILSGYLGEKDDAFARCEDIENLAAACPGQCSLWETRCLTFSRQLRRALETGRQDEFLVVPFGGD
jgi:hypothetical protein